MSNAIKADILLVLVTILAAISWIFSKEAVLLMPPLLFICSRFLLAGLLLLIVGFNQLSVLSWNQYRQAIIVGFIFALGMCFWVMGLHSGVSLSVASFITSSAVIFSPIISKIFFAEKVPSTTWYAIPFALVGLAFLSLSGEFEIQKGQLLFIVSALFVALFFVLNSRAANHREIVVLGEVTRVSKRVPALPLTAIALVTVGVLVGMLSFITEGWLEAAEGFSSTLLAWVLASAFIGTALRFFMQTHAQSLSSNSHGVVIMIVEPIWTALMAAAWFGESLSEKELIGCVLVFISIIIIRWTLIQRLLKRASA
ncbi:MULTISPECIES: DMT family transporter [Cycloclasticus]|uniref:Permease of the drug/metabolite transporter superfamily protein n=1 Tax=Cycloclasticus pugetii TaxID=34068 RepID=A0AB33Z5A2_9GAMM|nr:MULTISPECIES: DMT family transporter [Cycloclasticus]ATI03851.1 DMT family transporter [Cycloclasticus sp. PY97N]EPD14284.1 permease of the drug/metabolite transporter superfamily protein [Cycloclasticus pugetii]MBV1898850.1 DMT family transporter [Cycloclasticus sp.]